MPLLEMFREEVVLQTGNFRTALAASDGQGLVLAAHSTRGAAKICDIPKAASLAKEMEDLANALVRGTAKLTPEISAAMAEANELLALLGASDCDPAVWATTHQTVRETLEKKLSEYRR